MLLHFIFQELLTFKWQALVMPILWHGCIIGMAVISEFNIAGTTELYRRHYYYIGGIVLQLGL